MIYFEPLEIPMNSRAQPHPWRKHARSNILRDPGRWGIVFGNCLWPLFMQFLARQCLLLQHCWIHPCWGPLFENSRETAWYHAHHFGLSCWKLRSLHILANFRNTAPCIIYTTTMRCKMCKRSFQQNRQKWWLCYHAVSLEFAKSGPQYDDGIPHRLINQASHITQSKYHWTFFF